MLGKNCFRKIITSLTAFAILCVYSMVALAVPRDVTAEITVTGQVTVNGQGCYFEFDYRFRQHDSD
jgi:hypothetical protein